MELLCPDFQVSDCLLETLQSRNIEGPVRWPWVPVTRDGTKGLRYLEEIGWIFWVTERFSLMIVPFETLKSNLKSFVFACLNMWCLNWQLPTCATRRWLWPSCPGLVVMISMKAINTDAPAVPKSRTIWAGQLQSWTMGFLCWDETWWLKHLAILVAFAGRKRSSIYGLHQCLISLRRWNTRFVSHVRTLIGFFGIF